MDKAARTLVWGLGIVLVACGGRTDSGAVQAPTDGDASAFLNDATPFGGFALSVSPAQIDVLLGGSAGATVRLDPPPAVDTAVMIDGLPTGTDADPLIVSAGAIAATLTLRAQPDATPGGPIALTATAAGGAPTRFTITVRDVSGTGDVSFASGGLLSGDPIWAPSGVAAAADGSLVVSGPTTDGSDPPREVVRRFAVDGSVESAFGAFGKAIVGGSPAPLGQSLALLEDGRIAIFGASALPAGVGAFGARVNADGTIDATFGSAGVVTTGALGRGVVGLFADDGSQFALGDNAAARWNADGTIDPTFGGAAAQSGAASGAAGPAGTLVTADATGIWRYASNGAPDETFGTGGHVVLPWGNDADIATVRAVLIEPSGNVVVIGSQSDGGAISVQVARVTASGAPDTHFAGGAVVSIPSDFAGGGAELPDGRIIIWTEGGDLIALMPDGSFDATVGTNGIVALGAPGTILGATVDAQRRLVVTGLTSTTAQPGWFVRRYWL